MGDHPQVAEDVLVLCEANGEILRAHWHSSQKNNGAGDGIRTRNTQLGKLMRYRCATPAPAIPIVKEALEGRCRI